MISLKYKDILQSLKQEMQFEIYASCLMSNHAHILLKEQNIGDISVIMKRLLTRYAGWFNRKYSRSGSLIANRYKSQPIEKDEYLLSLVRYIHHHKNPIRAKIVTKIGRYKWSSYSEYIYKSKLTDTEFMLSMIDKKVLRNTISRRKKNFMR